MTPSASEIRVQDIDHCGIVAGIIDQMFKARANLAIAELKVAHQC